MKISIYFPLVAVSFAFALAVQVHAADPAPTDDKGKAKEPATVNKEELRKKLTPQQYAVACEGSTEPAFRNAYWNNHEPGIYVDVISGEPLFTSLDKFDSGTGWPSFTRTLKKDAIVEKKDDTYGMIRTEVRSAKSDAHLGHVFNDGPAPTGTRYCINSASLKFIPVAELKAKGYAEYLSLFEKDGKAKAEESAKK
jgi:methionine-R-sulfoxide reductase